MNINEMYSKIQTKCCDYKSCNICPLNNRTCDYQDDFMVKQHYKLMFPDKEEENNMKNYAMIDGKKIELNNKMVEIIKDSKIKYKEYNIGDITICPKTGDGYKLNDDDIIFMIKKTYCGCTSDFSINYEELPEVIEALTEIYNYLQEVR